MAWWKVFGRFVVFLVGFERVYGDCLGPGKCHLGACCWSRFRVGVESSKCRCMFQEAEKAYNGKASKNQKDILEFGLLRTFLDMLFEASRDISEAFWKRLEPSCAILEHVGPSWVLLKPSWEKLEDVSGALGTILAL